MNLTVNNTRSLFPPSFEQTQDCMPDVCAKGEHVEQTSQEKSVERVQVVSQQKLSGCRVAEVQNDTEAFTSIFLSGLLQKAIECAKNGRLNLSEKDRKLLMAHGIKVQYLDTSKFEDLHLYANEILEFCPRLEGQMKALFFSPSILRPVSKLLNVPTKLLINTLKTFKKSQFSEQATKRILASITNEFILRREQLTASEIAKITVALAPTIFFDEKIIAFLREKIGAYLHEMSLTEILDVAASTPLFVDESTLSVNQAILDEIVARLETLCCAEICQAGRVVVASNFGTWAFFERLQKKLTAEELRWGKENIYQVTTPRNAFLQPVPDATHKPLQKLVKKETPPAQFRETLRTNIREAKGRDELCLIWKDYGEQFEETLIVCMVCQMVEYGKLSLSAQKVILEIFEKAQLYFEKMPVKNLVSLCSAASYLDFTKTLFFEKVEETLLDGDINGIRKLHALLPQELHDLIYALNEVKYGSVRLARAIKNIFLNRTRYVLPLRDVPEENLVTLLNWFSKVPFQDPQIFHALEEEFVSRIFKDPFCKKLSKEQLYDVLELFAISGFGSQEFYQLLIDRISTARSLAPNIHPQFLAKLVQVLFDKKVKNLKFFALLEKELIKEEANEQAILAGLSREDIETLKAKLPLLGISSITVTRALETWHWAKTTFTC